MDYYKQDSFTAYICLRRFVTPVTETPVLSRDALDTPATRH